MWRPVRRISIAGLPFRMSAFVASGPRGFVDGTWHARWRKWLAANDGHLSTNLAVGIDGTNLSRDRRRRPRGHGFLTSAHFGRTPLMGSPSSRGRCDRGREEIRPRCGTLHIPLAAIPSRDFRVPCGFKAAASHHKTTGRFPLRTYGGARFPRSGSVAGNRSCSFG